MDLPEFPAVTTEALRAVSERHGLGAADADLLPQVGIFNRVYALGPHHILRVPRDHPAFIRAARNEAVAVPAARNAGVRTPDLVAFDDTLELLPVPYTVFERVHADTLGLLDVHPERAADAWRELGRDLAHLHTGVRRDGANGGLEPEPLPDPRLRLPELADEGLFTALEADWLGRWLARLEPYTLEPAEARFLHGDTQMTNLLVTPGLEYVAVIDWGAAGWGDPAHDFAGVPLGVVPFMLEGYREVAPLPGDDAAEARILRRHLHVAVFLLGRPPLPGTSWAERPLGVLLETLRFVAETPDDRWRQFVV